MIPLQTYAVLFLLDLQLSSVLEAPLHNIRLFAGALHELGLGDCGPAALLISPVRCRRGQTCATYNLEKSCSLMKCQTWDSGALMTADSTTEVLVGMAPDISG